MNKYNDINKGYRPTEWKPNAPINILIRYFGNKKSGKVTTSRTEIRRRFEYLDWKDQKRILHICLDSCSTDRLWAYGKLCRMWDDSFEEKVRTLWEETHEERSQWPVIRHLPISYILQHKDEFTDERDYYFICRRLVDEGLEPDLDRSRISDADFLTIRYLCGKEITEEEACQILYGGVAKLCVKGWDRMAFHVTEDHFLFMDMKDIIWRLEQIGLYQVTSDFEHWNKHAASEAHHSLINDECRYLGWQYREWLVRSSIFRCIEPCYIAAAGLTEEEIMSMTMPWEKAREIINGRDEEPTRTTDLSVEPPKEELFPPMSPDEYRETLERMKNENSAVRKLFDEMGVENRVVN